MQNISVMLQGNKPFAL